MIVRSPYLAETVVKEHMSSGEICILWTIVRCPLVTVWQAHRLLFWTKGFGEGTCEKSGEGPSESF